MKLKHIAAAAALVVSGSAFAVGPGTITFSGDDPVDISNATTSGSIFNDFYNFTVSGPGVLEGGVLAFNFGTRNILGLQVSLVNSVPSQVAVDNSPSEFSFSVASAGTYALVVSGFTTGSKGGYYSGSVGFTAAPVPEPETYALMLAGLGVVGFMAARRRQS